MSAEMHSDGSQAGIFETKSAVRECGRSDIQADKVIMIK